VSGTDLCWLVDLGHSRAKWAELCAGGSAADVRSASAAEFAALAVEAGVDRLVMAAVPSDAVVAPVLDALIAAGIECRRIGLDSPPLTVAPAYDSLGVDRWLAFNAAWRLRPGPLCVVDIGTATTVDVVDGRGRHRGGWILPGPDAARAGLLARAPGLERPREDPDAPLAPARSTAQALERGVLLQQAGALRLAVEAAGRELGARPCVVLTGGAAATVQSELEIDELRPDLVLHGLALAVTRMDLDP
jgi:type III pantothenate kinase